MPPISNKQNTQLITSVPTISYQTHKPKPAFPSSNINVQTKTKLVASLCCRHHKCLQAKTLRFLRFTNSYTCHNIIAGFLLKRLSFFINNNPQCLLGSGLFQLSLAVCASCASYTVLLMATYQVYNATTQ